MIDVLFISPGNATGIYQNLANDYAAVEPPTWALLLAQSCRSIGHTVSLIDANAEQLDKEEIANRIKNVNPRLICFVVYGQNVNSGTVNMSGAVYLSNYLKEEGKEFTFGMLLAMFQDAQEAKKKTDIKVGIVKAIHRILPMALAPFFPLAAVFGIIFGSTRAFNKILAPILNDPADDYESFLKALINRGMQVAEGEIPVKDRFTRAFVVSDNLIAAIRPEVLQKFATELSKKMAAENPDKVVPHDYIENEFKRFLNEKFDVDPPILTKDQLIENFKS